MSDKLELDGIAFAEKNRQAKPMTGKTSKYRGVTLFRASNKYQAFVKIDGKRVHLGMWHDEGEAALARDRAVLYYELDAPLNRPRKSRSVGPASPEELLKLAAERQASTESSKYRGVTWNSHRNRWDATLCVGTTKTVIAQFDQEKDAAVAYDRVAKRILGKDARLNFPNQRLRPATIAEMRAWTRRIWKQTTLSKYRGVTKDSRNGEWLAKILHHSKEYRLGTFTREKDAALAYDRAARRLKKSKARLNFG